MDKQIQKAKVKYQCRRGMLELDLILNHFLSDKFDTLTEAEIQAFEKLLSYQDPLLYHWLMDSTAEVEKDLQAIVSVIRDYTQTKTLR